MSGWEGYGVSVRCGALGCYQGTVAAADGGSLTLTKAFRNGFPYPKATVTLKATDIESLEIISEREEAAPAHSMVLAGGAGGTGAAGGAGRRRAARATVGETLQPPAAKPAINSSGNAAGGAVLPSGGAAAAGAAGGAGGRARGAGQPPRSKPIDIQGARPARTNAHSGSLGATGSLPKGRGGAGGAGGASGAGGERARRRNEACFGAAALDEMQQDFDFEGNLALFDKQALWQQMRPDVVRVAAARDELAAAGAAGGAAGAAGGAGAGGKLRHDQHVLRQAKPDTLPVSVPAEWRGETWYVTDDGVLVPSLSARARRRLWRALAAAPDALAPALTLLARAAADVALRLAGGTRRLDPRNAHQRPVVLAGVGRGAAGAAAACAARLLAAHGARTGVLAPPPGARCPLLARELAAYEAAGGRLLPVPSPTATTPLPAPDVLLLALEDPETDDLPPHYQQMVEWGLSGRGALLLLEGCAGGAGGGEAARLAAAARAVLAALLPPAGAGAGRLLLANVAPPPALFAPLAIRYRPPFGAHSLLPLHVHQPDPDPAPA